MSVPACSMMMMSLSVLTCCLSLVLLMCWMSLSVLACCLSLVRRSHTPSCPLSQRHSQDSCCRRRRPAPPCICLSPHNSQTRAVSAATMHSPGNAPAPWRVALLCMLLLRARRSPVSQAVQLPVLTPIPAAAHSSAHVRQQLVHAAVQTPSHQPPGWSP